MPSHLDEAVLRPAEVAGVVIPIAVEDATAIEAMMGRLDAAVVRPPFAHPALLFHGKRGEAFLHLTRPRRGP